MKFSCPRCIAKAEAETYGPCADCRMLLVETQFSVPNEYTRRTMVGGVEYVPKMNVTPNAVATKEEW